MWIMTMFDLPTDTVKEKRAYYRFRKILLKWGYEPLQKSVYVKYCASDDYCGTMRRLVEGIAPFAGRVNSFTFTDAEFDRQDFFQDGDRASPPAKPRQAEFF